MQGEVRLPVLFAGRQLDIDGPAAHRTILDVTLAKATAFVDPDADGLPAIRTVPDGFHAASLRRLRERRTQLLELFAQLDDLADRQRRMREKVGRYPTGTLLERKAGGGEVDEDLALVVV